MEEVVDGWPTGRRCPGAWVPFCLMRFENDMRLLSGAMVDERAIGGCDDGLDSSVVDAGQKFPSRGIIRWP